MAVARSFGGVAMWRYAEIPLQAAMSMLSLIRAGFDTLEARREQLTERFFRRSVLPETSCLYYLLP